MVNIYEAGPLEGRIAHWPVLAAAGVLEVRLAETDMEVEAAQRLRYHVFYQEMSAIPSPEMVQSGRDFDHFDDVCDHLLVVDRSVIDDDGQPAVVGTYRLMRDVDAKRAGGFYTGSEYDISPMLNGLPANTKLLELGRSCVLKEYRSRPGAMQLLWRGISVYLARFSIEVMFGCASFAGIDPKALALPLSYLYHFHLAAPEIRVRANPSLYVDMNLMPKEAIDPKEALRTLPPLLKGYVRAGAGIGDGAVVDRQFGTTDVFIYFPVKSLEGRYSRKFEVKQ
ncbi:GNAT family N-acetyltransferase [Rhizomicrobium electricum]|uniref:L-ornithine N(alpha)-acyltransferase n=1 Tax=Rhizomicrobium electricum TaxID=480070 RepID=A0ABP3QFX6_9PROT|nr:GNAT family N-acyltransferase [Rhizomicrobium electricum]NIJ49197.1 putative hemolysin [Rhizomicrobium electricum]